MPLEAQLLMVLASSLSVGVAVASLIHVLGVFDE